LPPLIALLGVYFSIMNVLSHLFESFLTCPTKCFLRAHAEAGLGNEYADWVKSQSSTYRCQALKQLQDGLPHGGCVFDPPSAKQLKSNNWLLAVNVPANTERLTTQVHAVERVPSHNPTKPAQFMPIRFVCFNKLTKDDRLLLAFDAFVLSKATGQNINVGKIIYGDNHATVKVNIPNLLQEACKLIGKTTALVACDSPPELILNRHCSECEFQAQCRQKATEMDDLSLLSGMTEKERRKHRMRGIFTVTQLSYTFRPRRTPKRAKNPSSLHYFSLQALAIKENKIYVHGNQALPDSKTQVYLDIEGLPDRDSYYLIGSLIVSEGQEHFNTFWAQTKADELSMFVQFLESVSTMTDYRVFHYGDYEKVALKRIIPRLPQHLQQVGRAILAESVNVLSFLYSHIYFPVYSNSLKQIGNYLGQAWSIPDSSGLKSIVWRMKWERSHDEKLKQMLVSYNHDDCLALKALMVFISSLPTASDIKNPDLREDKIGFTENIANREDTPNYGKSTTNGFEGYQDIIQFAYFDYQRAKVYVRTNPRLRNINRRIRRNTLRTLRPNVRIELRAFKCPHCNGTKIMRDTLKCHCKNMLDLRISSGGIRRWITQYTTPYHKCLDCDKWFVPASYKYKSPFGRTLMIWAMLQHVCNRMTYEHIAATARDCFGLQITVQSVCRFKAVLAGYYRITNRMLMGKLLIGKLIHADETKILLKKGSGYVWVFAGMEEVVYMYRPNRKTDFLHGLLNRFRGVLVSDFYTGYDSLKCVQQKCLVHLIRDVNDELLMFPFDEELGEIGKTFGSMLRDIITTVDKHGLKKYWLRPHQHDVQRYFDGLAVKEYNSDTAVALRKRLLKYKAKLFTFLEYDGVPWNNNNAEHAIKVFAKYRRLVNGRVTENGIRDYLVLLSIYQTCEYRGISFFKFMLSGLRNIDTYCDSHTTGK
jgi:predicted RecB family nuclease